MEREETGGFTDMTPTEIHVVNTLSDSLTVLLNGSRLEQSPELIIQTKRTLESVHGNQLQWALFFHQHSDQTFLFDTWTLPVVLWILMPARDDDDDDDGGCKGWNGGKDLCLLVL